MKQLSFSRVTASTTTIKRAIGGKEVKTFRGKKKFLVFLLEGEEKRATNGREE